MGKLFRLAGAIAAFHVLLFANVISAKTPAAADAIASKFAEVDDTKLHYLTAGKGPAVILLHGYTQTSRMWKPIIPLLAEKFTVIAPDLPGIGDGYSHEGSGHEERGHNHSCAGQVAGNPESQSGWA
jgi:alpha-beta hydrolase superfamily lysophospholipase